MSVKRDWILDRRQENIFQNLWNQVEKHFDFRSGQQGYRGNERYRKGLRAFCKVLARDFGSQNFRNISDKHLQRFISESKAAGVSPKTLKTDLSAIRKLHERIPGAKNQLGTNKELGYTDKRISRGVDRAWTDKEVDRAMHLAASMQRYDVRNSIGIARYCGLRVEEVTALTKTQLRNALNKDRLSLRTTKGGIPRDVPVSEEAKHLFREILNHTPREKVFIEHGRQHHQVFKSIQNWITNHREVFQDSHRGSSDREYQEQLQINERPNCTFHGLRHAYAREQYFARIDVGVPPLEARTEVSELLGHGRDDVTRIYLGGV